MTRPNRLVWALAGLLASTACASGFNPIPMNDVPFLERSQTQSRNGFTVTTAVPNGREARALFGKNLYRRGVQPVWLEIENERDETVAFLPVGLDPQYFPPMEAANLDLKDSGKIHAQRSNYYFDRSMDMWIAPGETRRGYLFTKLDEGTKAFNVDVISEGDVTTFTFFVPVPGLVIDHHAIDFDTIYPADERLDLDAEALLAWLDEQACCTTDKKAEGTGDPLNLVVIGEPDDLYTAFIRAGWDETEAITRISLLKMARSFVAGSEYRYSPVSGLYVFGRPQDVAFQKARENIDERNHLRLWMSPVRFEGKPVWLGQISRDIGVRFTRKTITTHKIDPDVDETREFLVENLAYSQSLSRYGYAGGVGAAPMDAPRGNLTGDPYFTDGYRVVIWVASEPVGIGDIGYAEWATPPSETD